MKKIIAIILILIGAVNSIATAKKKASGTPAITSITMQRTVCYGRCPDYTIEINKNGMTTYTAVRFNEDTGIYQKNIGSKKAKQIFSEFASYRVDTCSERYEKIISDLPGLIFTIKYANRTQKIANANFGPAFLKSLAETMDTYGKKSGNGWKKTGMPKLD
jgi:hypothetical protein